MIENEIQYQHSLKRLEELTTAINEVMGSHKDPLRNQLLLASLNITKQKIEAEVSSYEFRLNKQ